jgi:hypothetical protein
MKSLFAVLLVMLGLTGQPVFADILPALCGDIAEADPKPEPDEEEEEEEEEPDCE